MSSNTVFGAYGSNPDDGVPDMTSISNIDEAGINKNLHVRYVNDRIYTYTGTILVAVNPYRELDIYSQDVISSYNSHKIGELEPHIFALAEAAYTSLKRAEGNQSCVISGESGSGKTETTKFILQYLCSVTSGVSTWVEHQILEANTILEAFGNAKTVRNDNSSRFGRFMQVCFDSKWHIRGCIMQDYLLEQSRITFQSTQERNYHVFYQLVAAAQRDNELAERYQLHGTAQFRYLNQSGCVRLDGVDDAERFDALRLAFSVLQMQSGTSEGLFATLAAILWLGNLSFEDVDGGERSDLSPADADILQIVTKLLGLLEEDVRLVLLFRQINVRGNITEIPLKPHEARENRHAMAKALYSRAFAWLVNQINTCTNPGQDTGAFLGVLDIFGFENFKKNSFEQLCINYTNEKLHTFFNHYVFKLEQEAYRQEGIKFSHIEFSDNSVCLELIEKPPRCILKLLSEECRMPKGSDETLLSKLHQEFEAHGYYVKGDDRRNWELQFGICHYAGAVTYCIDGFVDKNRDAQQDLFFDFMRRSQNCFVQELAQFQDLLSCMSRTGTIASTTSSRGTSKIKPTVSDAFRQQLQALVELLQASNPWYVRCIKPNASKRADCYDDQLVMDQLKYLGMLDIIRIRRQGFPVHMRFADFLQRYRCLSKRRWKRTQITDGCKHILSQEDRQQRQWQLGKTMVFLRHCIHEPLEERRGQLMQRSALLIQRIYRGHVRRSEYRRKLAAVVCLQRHYRTKRQRLQFLRLRRAAVVLQSYLRGMYGREVASALREMKAMDEERQRRDNMEEERRKQEEQRRELEDAETQVIRDLEKDESMDMTTNGTIAQDDLNTMAEIAEQLNLKLSAAVDPAGPGGGAGQPRSPSSVDLDSLFSFLADVQTNRGNVVNQIRDDLDELQETVMAEMSELSLSRTAAEDTDADDADEELRAVSATPPLPPPEAEVLSSAKDVPSSPDSPLHLPAGIPNGIHNGPGQAVEPIYESVMVRRPSDDLPSPSQLPPPIVPAVASEEPPAIPSVPPPAGLPPLVTAAGRERVQRAARRRGLQQHSRSRSPEQLSSAAAAVRTSRQNSRAGSRLSHGDDEDREQRRRQRVEKKLLELQTSSERQQLTSSTSTAAPGGREVQDAPPEHFDMIQFAETYFNVHERLPEGAIITTLSRRGKASVLYVPKYEMITYTRAPSIPTSHVHLYDPENVQLACSIFKDMQQYLKGGVKPDVEIKTLQSILQHGIEREELRNEIYVQCIRQATNNPTPESAERVWLILSLCSVSFPPGKILYKYYLSYLRKCQQSADGRCLQYVRWCLDNCKHTNITCRKNPPSTVEITAMKRLGTIVCRFFFLDGRTKAVDVHPLDTASDAMAKIADRINLWNLDGWALFQASNGTESHVKSHEFLYDVIASWEIGQKSEGSPLQSPQLRRQTLPVVSSPSTTNSSAAAAGENRFIFKKRLFRSCKEIPNDPVEVHLLYAQAVHAVVKSDCLPVSEKVALQLAGLQAQVLLGDPKDKYDHYSDVSTLLSQRIAATKRQLDWTPILAHAHHQYGSGKSELVAKIWYLSSVMQYPVWGTTQFPVKYKGYWPYGSNLLMGINSDGILLIKPEDKYVIVEFPYPDVESIILDNTDSFITVNLHRKYDAQRVYVFEARDQQEIGALVASYSPEHAGWIKEVDNISRRVQHITNDDRVRLYHNVIQCRRNLVDAELLKKPSDVGASNFFKNTLRKLSRAKMERLRQSGMIGDGGAADLYKGFDRGFWAFSRQPLTQSLSRVGDPELEEASLHISQAVLMFSGLISSDQLSENAGDENNVRLVQGIIERSMKSEPLTNEVTLQLIKQTTDHPDPNSRVNRRNWSMLTLLCSTAVPSSLPVRRYLSAHLTKCASDYVTEEGKYARFAEKCMHKTVSSRRRQWPPSRQEVLCTINCRPIHARFHFMDGQFHSVEFDAAATAAEVLLLVKEKIGLRLDAKGYAIYEVLGQSERNLLPDETLADVMSKWERYHAASAGSDRARKQHIFLFKKHLLCEETLDLEDPVEKELLYHQMLHNVRNDKFPLTSMEAVMLTALRAQIELGDHHMSQIDYQQVMAYTLPPRLAGSISVQTVTVHHQSVEGMSPDQAKKAFLNLIQSWPFYRASIFEVVQSFTSNWPKTLWLAVDEAGTHLLDFRSRNVLCTYDYDYIVNYSPAINSLMIITGNTRKQSKIILNTSQAFMIANLINDYMELIRHRVESQRDAVVAGR